MEFSIGGWVGFNAFVVAMLALDLFVFHPKSHEVRLRETLIWSGVWIALAMAVNLGLVDVVPIPIAVSVIVVAGILVVAVIFSLWRSSSAPAKDTMVIASEPDSAFARNVPEQFNCGREQRVHETGTIV